MTFSALKLPILRMLGVALLAGPFGARAEDVCRDLRVTVDMTRRQIEEFTVQQVELNEKFKKFVEDDFNTQAEGVVNEIHHNSAVKVAFARKRLKQAIESKQLILVTSKNEYCGKCGKSLGMMDKAVFCERCPSSVSCATARK